ncbi:MAG: hypothetical protein MI975_13220 [Cytophagales bacterium]|nr:hypothetical protein [Cytophagales bacterium]
MIRSIGISVFFLLFLAAPLIGNAQCKVLLEAISGEYEGGCKKGKADGKGLAKGTDSYEGNFKKGLPEGQGIYIWADGTSYVGTYKKGKKNGAGKMTYKTQAGDSVVTGYWVNDGYIGTEKTPYKVLFKSPEIISTRFSRSDGNDELIFVFQKGGKVENPGDIQVINMEGSFGNIVSEGLSQKVTAVRYPFRGKMSVGDKTMEFKISQSGSWKITVNYN